MFWSFVRDNTLTKLLFCLNQYGVHRMLTNGFDVKFEHFSVKHLADMRRLEWLKNNTGK
jgi:hypothetical protein